jgi:hypothetical protein
MIKRGVCAMHSDAYQTGAIKRKESAIRIEAKRIEVMPNVGKYMLVLTIDSLLSILDSLCIQKQKFSVASVRGLCKCKNISLVLSVMR